VWGAGRILKVLLLVVLKFNLAFLNVPESTVIPCFLWSLTSRFELFADVQSSLRKIVFLSDFQIIGRKV
jgi:hypothetical protein